MPTYLSYCHENNTINKLPFFINPIFWFQAAIISAPLRAYPIIQIGGFNISFFRLFSIIAIIFFVFELIKRPFLRIPRGNIMLLLLFINLIMIIIPIMYSSNLFSGDSFSRFIIKLTGWIWVIVFSLLVMKYPVSFKRFLNTFLYSSVIPMLIGWYQLIQFYTFHQIPKLPFSNIDALNEKASGILYESYFRPSGPFLEPNYFGYFLGVVFLIILTQILNEGLNKNKLKIIILSSSGLLLIGTMSLSAIIGVAIGIIYIGFLSDTKKLFRLIKLSLTTMIVLLLFSYKLGIAQKIFEALFFKVSVRSTQTDSMFGRDTFFNALYDSLVSSNGLGVGYGGITEFTGSEISTIHNALLTVLAEQGIISFIVLITIFLVTIAKLIVRGVSKKDNSFNNSCIALGAALSALIVGNLVYDGMFSFDASWVLIALSISLYFLVNPQLTTAVRQTPMSEENFGTIYK